LGIDNEGYLILASNYQRGATFFLSACCKEKKAIILKWKDKDVYVTAWKGDRDWTVQAQAKIIQEWEEWYFIPSGVGNVNGGSFFDSSVIDGSLVSMDIKEMECGVVIASGGAFNTAWLYHDAVVCGLLDCGTDYVMWVVEYGAENPGEEHKNAKVWLNQHWLSPYEQKQVRPYSKNGNRDVTTSRALSQVGTRTEYNLIFNNCQSFACWCVTGNYLSPQVAQCIVSTFEMGYRLLIKN